MMLPTISGYDQQNIVPNDNGMLEVFKTLGKSLTKTTIKNEQTTEPCDMSEGTVAADERLEPT